MSAIPTKPGRLALSAHVAVTPESQALQSCVGHYERASEAMRSAQLALVRAALVAGLKLEYHDVDSGSTLVLSRQGTSYCSYAGEPVEVNFNLGEAQPAVLARLAADAHHKAAW